MDKGISDIFVKGITGFDIPPNYTIHSIEMIKAILKRFSYPFIQIEDLSLPNQSTNYFTVYFINKRDHNQFNLLIHQHLWYFACVESTSNWMNLQFIDFPKNFRNSLSQTRFPIHLFKASFLNSSIIEENLNNLSKSEIQQVKYWNTKTYGEVIFNGYD